jgi:hypothetical protein
MIFLLHLSILIGIDPVETNEALGLARIHLARVVLEKKLCHTDTWGGSGERAAN